MASRAGWCRGRITHTTVRQGERKKLALSNNLNLVNACALKLKESGAMSGSGPASLAPKLMTGRTVMQSQRGWRQSLLRELRVLIAAIR